MIDPYHILIRLGNPVKALENVLEQHPSTGLVVGTAVAGNGVVQVVTEAHDILGLISLFIGCLIGVVTLAIQWKKYKMLK